MKKILSLISFFIILIGCSTDKDTVTVVYPEGEDPSVYEEFNISKDFVYFIDKENDLIQFAKFNNNSVYIKLFEYSDKKPLINVSDTIQSHTIDLGFGEHVTFQPDRVFPIGYVQNKSTNCYTFLLRDSKQGYKHTYIKVYFENTTNGKIRKEALFYQISETPKIKTIDNGFLLGNEYFSRIYNVDGSLYLEDQSGLDLSEAYSLNKNLYVHFNQTNIYFNQTNIYNGSVITAWRYDVSTQEKKNIDVFHWDYNKLKVKKTSSKIEGGILYIHIETVSLEGVFKDLTFRIDIQSMQIL